jgi:hypothetical protein
MASTNGDRQFQSKSSQITLTNHDAQKSSANSERRSSSHDYGSSVVFPPHPARSHTLFPGETVGEPPNGYRHINAISRQDAAPFEPSDELTEPPSLWIRDTWGRTLLEVSLKGDQCKAVSLLPSPKIRGRMSDVDTDGRMSDEEKGNSGPPAPVGFWNKSLNKTRLKVFARWGIMSTLNLEIQSYILTQIATILAAFILAVLSIYWGVLFNVDDNLNSIIVFVVDFETGPDALVGPLVTGMTESIVQENKMAHLGFITIPPSAYDNDHMAVREAIYEEEAWAAIVINSNATSLLREAVAIGNSSYDPTGAIQLIYLEARDQDSYYEYIYPNMQMLQQQIMQEFGQKWASEIMANRSITKENMERAPQAVNPGIGFATFSLRPFVPYVAVPAVSIGLIYLIIMSFFSFSFFLPIHMEFLKPDGHPPLKFYQVIIWRWSATMAAYLILSLAYSLVSLAFQIPFDQPKGSHYETATDPNAFGEGTFPVYWMINYL